jgi:hypothetical protein
MTEEVCVQARPRPAWPLPQPVLSPLTAAAIFLVVTVSPAGERAVRDLLAGVTALQRSVGFRFPAGAWSAWRRSARLPGTPSSRAAAM